MASESISSEAESGLREDEASIGGAGGGRTEALRPVDLVAEGGGAGDVEEPPVPGVDRHPGAALSTTRRGT